MTKSILEGLITPKVNIDMDMSEKTNTTYNIGTYVDKVEIKVGNLIINDKETAEQIMAILGLQPPIATVTKEE